MNHAILGNEDGLRLFVKVYAKDAATEYSKARQIYEMSQKAACFGTPKPLDLVARHSIIIWEYVPGLIGLRTFLVQARHLTGQNNKSYNKIFRACGQTLATIHSSLSLDFQGREIRPSVQIDKSWTELCSQVDQVLKESPVHHIHGDFACANIFIKPPLAEEPEIVVLDSCPNNWMYGDVPTSGLSQVYWDLAHFVASLNSDIQFTYYFRKQIDSFFHEFITGYQELLPYNIDKPAVMALAAALLSEYKEYRRLKAKTGLLNAWGVEKFRGHMVKRLYKAAVHMQMSIKADL